MSWPSSDSFALGSSSETKTHAYRRRAVGLIRLGSIHVVADALHGAANRLIGTRLQMATDTEQRYLAAMAGAGSAPYRSADVAHRFGARDQRGVSVHREALIQKGLIWSPRRGQLDFTVPLFAEYLTENHPLDAFEENA